MAFITALSNYLGYMSLLIFIGFRLSDWLIEKIKAKNYKFPTKNTFVTLIIFALIAVIYLFPFFKYVYFKEARSEIDSSATRVSYIDKNLENFFTFTTRPWYYVFPSTDNPHYGEMSKLILFKLQNDWGYWLTSNYFKSEHSASYLGWANIIVGLIGLRFLLIGFKKKTLSSQETLILKFTVVGLMAILFSLPPYFTINNFKIYTPSYILWELFPMFRVLSRFGIIVFISNLMLVGIGLREILKNSKSYFRISFLGIFLTLNFMELYIPLQINNVSQIPSIYEELMEESKEGESFVVYPYNTTAEVLLWLPEIKRNFFNTSYFISSNERLPEDLVNDLNKCEGLSEIAKIGVDYLLYFYRQDANYFNNQGPYLENTKAVYSKLPILELLTENEYIGGGEYSNIFYRYAENGDVSKNSAVLYRISPLYNEKDQFSCPKKIVI